MMVARILVPLLAACLVAGCAPRSGGEAGHGHDHGGGGHDHGSGGHDHGDGGHDHGGGDSWAVTAWGEHFEIFAEADPLVAGHSSNSHTHVTALRDFSPVTEGLVEIVLRRDGQETAYAEEMPLRDGIFDVSIDAEEEGVFELFFRIEDAVHREEIAAGTVRVGTDHEPGGLEDEPGDADGDLISFLKEQQWKTSFATEWAEQGELPLVTRGSGRVRAKAGGEVTLAAPMNAVVGGDPWPHVGRSVKAGERLFALTPHVAADRSLAELEAAETERREALRVARDRLIRLEELLAAQAASPAEVEAARASLAMMRAQHEAARSDLGTARAGRAGRSGSGESVAVVSPLAGQIADVRVQPGQVVPAGGALGRVVTVRPLWVEAYLRPAQAVALGDTPGGLALRASGMENPVVVSAADVRLVSRSPEVHPTNGTVTCIFEVDGDVPQLLGSAVEVEVTLPETRAGVVVPASSIVDDGGTPVVYTQYDGEAFLRREVEVVARQGNTLLVRGLRAGERVVTTGGSTIRRATLVASGVGHGHVH